MLNNTTDKVPPTTGVNYAQSLFGMQLQILIKKQKVFEFLNNTAQVFKCLI